MQQKSTQNRKTIEIIYRFYKAVALLFLHGGKESAILKMVFLEIPGG